MAERKLGHQDHMNVVVRGGSRAAAAVGARARLKPLEIAAGIAQHPELDLTFHGGWTIRDLAYYNLFIGGQTGWNASDVSNINDALSKAMSDRNLNNVLVQYFNNQPISSSFLGSRVLAGSAPHFVTKGDIEAAMTQLFTRGTLAGLSAGIDFHRTVFNLFLPRNTLLFTDDAPSGGRLAPQRRAAVAANVDAAPSGSVAAEGALREEEDSLHGLGGFHGSVMVPSLGGGMQAIYYAAGVFSTLLTRHRHNGIPFFSDPWKNVVATFYHELTEARTDPDVEQADRMRDDNLLGWYTDNAGEIGDLPMDLAGANLGLVMKEVPLAGGGTVPVQLQWSNAVNGPEGPIPAPH